jgi:hypothetical protein
VATNTASGKVYRLRLPEADTERSVGRRARPPAFSSWDQRRRLHREETAMRLRCSSTVLCLLFAGALLLTFGVPFFNPLQATASQAGERVTKTIQTAKFAEDIAPLLDRHCTRCHGGAKPKGKLALDKYKDDSSVIKDLETWQKVAQRIRSHEMPPPENPQLTSVDAQFITGWIDAKLARFLCTGDVDPGKVTLRRLNRAEYNNTIRDLVAIDFKPADDFPADDVGYGFDNIGDVLSVPPLLMEKYLAAAEKIVARAWATAAARKRIMIYQPSGKNDDECSAKILENFARRAYRRPIAADELKRLVSFTKTARSPDDDFEKGIQLALQVILTSPHFIFRVERDADPDETGPFLLTEFELATRLSYFLWSSMPDEALFAQARAGTLRANLEAQVRRMLKNPRSEALFESFASQWLQTRNLQKATPDPAQFSGFDEPLRQAMLRETEKFFMTVLSEDRSILDFIDSDFTFVNERLAKHYGIAGIRGNYVRRVSLSGKQRGGLLTQASVLTVTSNPTRTSPVKRGKWILENILGTPPPPPLPDAGQLNESKEAVLSASLRQRMEQHRANPNCALCHQRMDPLGFALENYDAIGAWRDRDGRFKIDTAATLPDGTSFNGPIELRKVLLERKDDFCKCLAERLLTYAVGRGMERDDKCVIERIARTTGQDNYKLSRMIAEVVKSEPFQMGKTVRSNDGK